LETDATTEKRILESAYKLFRERGFRGTSMRDIAGEAGIKAGSIYNHFRGKEEIFEAVFIEKHPMFRILGILDGVNGETLEELLTNAISQLNNELQEKSGLLNLFFVELVEMDGKHIPEAIRTNFPMDSRFMKHVFAMKADMRSIREPVLVRALIGTIFANIIFGWFIGDVNSKRWGTLAEMTDVLLRGILKSE
jgi:AcrR family transcriptional regulator